MASDEAMFVDANSINKQYNLHVRIKSRATFQCTLFYEG